MPGREREKRLPPSAARRSQPARNRWDWRLSGTAYRASAFAPGLPPADAGRLLPEPYFASAASFPDFDAIPQGSTALLPDNDPGLPTVARSSSMAPRAEAALSRTRGRAAIAISAACHVALLLFSVHFAQDAARIAGGEQSGVVLLGNADQDQRRSGERAEQNVTHVSLISVSKARPVETVTAALAATVEVPEAAAPVEAVQPSQAIVPVEEASAEPETIVAETVAPTAATETIPAAPSPDDVPPILATDRATAVASPEVIEERAEAEAEDGAKPVEPAKASSSEPVAPVQPVEASRSEQPVEVVEIPPLPQQVEERPSPAKRARQAEKHEEDEVKTAKHAERKAKAPSNGSLGKGSADQRKGRAEGSENGRQVAAGRGRAASAEGNAAVSNYPGRIVRKLRRALRYPRGAGSRRLRGVAEVRFVISSGGAVGGVHLVASSGSPILDKAALEAVRRAAPFPPIPAEAGRSNWPFTVPLAFVR